MLLNWFKTSILAQSIHFIHWANVWSFLAIDSNISIDGNRKKTKFGWDLVDNWCEKRQMIEKSMGELVSSLSSSSPKKLAGTKKKKAIKKFGQVSIELMVKIGWNLFKIQREIGCKLVGELMQSSVKIWLRIWPKLVWNFGLKSTSGNWLGNSNEFLQKPPKNWYEIDGKIYQKLGTPKIGVVSVIKSCQNWLQIDG